MWCADNWKDYELIDASDGERLERWGKYILVRPDPQIIWRKMKKSAMWKKADASYSRSRSGAHPVKHTSARANANSRAFMRYASFRSVCSLITGPDPHPPG